ncbi:hypothetical protein GGE67_005330 [Rhizobium leucaenae]|nr:hypothetical protein [Rhizobium leucaenae]
MAQEKGRDRGRANDSRGGLKCLKMKKPHSQRGECGFLKTGSPGRSQAHDFTNFTENRLRFFLIIPKLVAAMVIHTVNYNNHGELGKRLGNDGSQSPYRHRDKKQQQSEAPRWRWPVATHFKEWRPILGLYLR